MGISDTFRRLADVFGSIEQDKREIGELTVSDGQLRTDEAIKASVIVREQFIEGANMDGLDIEPDDVTLQDDGTLQFELSVSVPAHQSGGEMDATPDLESSGQQMTDGGNPPTLEQPPHHDPSKLREVYDEHDTFPEMRDSLGVEVTPQTVRNQMIKHGIHEPRVAEADDSSREGSREPVDEDSEITEEHPSEDETDWDGVTVERTMDVLSMATDVEDFEEGLSLSRSEAFKLLNDLELINQATGDLSTTKVGRASSSDLQSRVETQLEAR